jgi:hypothetical protein
MSAYMSANLGLVMDSSDVPNLAIEADRLRFRSTPTLKGCTRMTPAPLLFGLVLATLHTNVLACSLAPAPLDQVALSIWTKAQKVCVVIVENDSLVLTSESPPHPWRSWRANTRALESLKGTCSSESTTFQEIPGATCGLGMPPLGSALLATFDLSGQMTWWSAPDGQLGVHFRKLASVGSK